MKKSSISSNKNLNIELYLGFSKAENIESFAKANLPKLKSVKYFSMMIKT